MATKPYIIALEEHYFDAEVRTHVSGLDATTAPRIVERLDDLVFGAWDPIPDDGWTAAKKAGVNNYIVKPFNAATLKTKIEAVFPDLATA